MMALDRQVLKVQLVAKESLEIKDREVMLVLMELLVQLVVLEIEG